MFQLSVLHINSAETWRGGERQTLLLAQGLGGHGITSCIAASPGSALLVHARAAQLPTLAVRIRSEWDVAAIIRLRRFIRKNRIPVVHAHTSHAHGAAAFALLANRSTALVVTRRVDSPDSGRTGLSRIKYNRCNRIIAISDKIRDNLIAGGMPQEKIVRIYSGIDTGKFADMPKREKAREMLSVPSDAMIIGTIGALTREKDHATLLQAARAVCAEKPNAVFVIIGSGPERKALEAQAEALGIQNAVVFAGQRRDA